MTDDLDKSTFPTERRQSRRLKDNCEAQIIANLSILDSDAGPLPEPLIFLGVTKDLSAEGLGVILPSASISENYCSETKGLKLSLYLPDGAVALEVRPVRCVPIDENDTSGGFLMGAEIIGVNEHREEFERYLRALSSKTPEAKP
jgi:hypothetical protein